jgi:hypothetical protein
MSQPDEVVRRIVAEYGQLYVYLYVTDGNGKVLEDDRFTQPYRLDRKDAIEEAKEFFDRAYDWVNETINWPSASDGGGSGSVEE